MKRLFLVMSHNLTQDQIESFGGEIIKLDGGLAEAAKNLPAEWSWSKVRDLALEIVMSADSKGCTHISVMGEPALVTACFQAVRAVSSMKFIQSTTQRISVDTPQPDGTVVKTAVFKHVQWREWD